ncbi:IclR family transcriptional regulator [Mycolicibacterium elephantis]|uniref:IclR family transcriptional regulator n=1 Tax=Mycolicibacterium elephantis TaxID=81858 RepID=UPI0009EE9100|nr:IclR family transcriptional regulator [Mycolicibacterium elephantis]
MNADVAAAEIAVFEEVAADRESDYRHSEIAHVLDFESTASWVGTERPRGSRTTNSSGQPDLRTSVGKALALLNAFDSSASVLGVTALADAAGLPKSTAYRLLVALQSSGFVERRGTGYCVGRRMFELGNLVAACRPRNLRDVALPFLSDLYELSHETVHLATLEGAEVLYLEKLFGHNKLRVPSHIGKRFPAHCSAIGKAMLAFSDDVTVDAVIRQGLKPRTPYSIVVPGNLRRSLKRSRQYGVAYDREESAIGVACVAAPILCRGEVVAGISISGPPPNYDPVRYAGAVRKAAAGIAAKLASPI